ncbi:hypothetical protein D3C75_1382140 [compost metagenome]
MLPGNSKSFFPCNGFDNLEARTLEIHPQKIAYRLLIFQYQHLHSSPPSYC